MLNLSRHSLRVALLATTALASPALAQDAFELDAIVVDGSSYETETSGSYSTDLISVGEKATMSPREVPQSTSVVTRKQIEDGGYTALEEALTDVPGIMILNNNVGRSSIFSRGYEFDYLYFDGLPAPVSSIYGTQPDLSMVDHIEVLKGPAGLFIGTGEPAGSINMRLKQAAATAFQGYATTSIDSNGHARAEIDVSDKLNADGTLRGRFVAAYGDGDSFVDGVENGVTSLYGTLAWDVTPDTHLTFSLSHMERDIIPYNGLPTYADGSLIWMDPSATTVLDWNTFENETTDAVIAAEHFLDNGGRVKFSLRRSQQDADFLYGYSGSVAAADNTISSLSWLDRDFDQDSLALDLHAELPFQLGDWDGNAIIGADWQKVDSTMYQARGSIAGSWDLDNWDSGAVAVPGATYSTRTDTETTSKGLYTQVRLSPVEPLTLIGGARLSWYEGTVDTVTLATGATTSDRYDVSAQVTPFAGVTYDLTPNTTLYASYSEIFIPQSYVDVNGNLLDPIEGQQYEIGVKATLGYGLNVSAALFDLRETNRPEAVTGTSYYVADEEVRSRGLELEMSGEFSENLHVAAGYTFTDTEYLTGSSAGNPFSTYTPEHMLKLTGSYDVTEGLFAGWSLGGRLTVMSSFSSRGIVAPGYGVVDLMVAKTFANDVTLRLGVDNLFDKDYYTRVGSTTVFNFRGAPRAFNLALTKTF
ncbi:TonB-dependent siderophore receptor [Pseudodonghicola flavimaris]|uniref:TonB-dependent siderophore receptor n=1 Tax=Pseudodonghicola flavimaris TaxID=3050036 RepID=A0ABT7EYP9_9RHOB|nr:TonB-dependent siderophore receptor [Pseudodonghicola flavimaris]MDK3017476.1 TonB-dependent siderophore receptor [Pseudodonghicola flavimaris]